MNENKSVGGTKLSRALFEHLPTEAFLDTLPVGIYACAPDGTVVQYNSRAAELWGRSPPLGETDERFCGSHRLYWTDGRVLPHDHTPMAIALREQKSFKNVAVVIERPDGTRVTALVNIEPVYDKEGTFRGAVNCFQDVTEEARAHAHAQRKERELDDTLRALPAAIYRTDAKGRVIFYNEAAVVLAGRRPEIGVDQWCISWRIYTTEGEALPHSECPMAVAIREQRPIVGAEILVEQPSGERVPCLVYPTPLFDENGALTGAVNMLIDISDRKQSENQQRLLINELNHRVKNTLAMVQAIATQTLRRSRSPSEFVASLSGRIQAFARAHNTLVYGTNGVDLRDLLNDQVLLDPAGTGRVVCSGPPVQLEATVALHLALVLYELGTNARKYGALSVSGGRVLIDWSAEREGRPELNLHWREEGGPPVSDTHTAGFGTALIERSLHSHGADATMNFAGSGLECTIRMPLPHTLASVARATTPAAAPVWSEAGEAGPLEGRRVILVEDEPLVALDLESLLSRAGCTVIGPAASVPEALRLVREYGEADAALIDANLQGEPVDEVAAALTRSGTRFAFISGYGREGLPASFREAPLIAKPFVAEDVLSCLNELLNDSGATPIRRRSGDD